VQRVLVIGQSGSGKSTLARRLAEHLGARHIELDALFHGPAWTPRPTFAADVDQATRADRWVVDGNYTAVRDLIWSRADTLVWLDLPRTTTLRRALVRTGRRLLTRVELWNGNRERLRTLLRATHPIRMTWQTHGERRALHEKRLADPAWAHLDVVRLRTPAEVTRWLTQL
jgi:adenylate kinase family enzyme